ncbi:MAG TPA: hypothetical protein VI583_17515 [Cyclobacteriaceae bacterium]|nr:hypothetical protein [Cyclobacteriaceae bacterium]
MHKIKITALLIALVILGISACAQKTCPTYTRNDSAQQNTAQSQRN